MTLSGRVGHLLVHVHSVEVIFLRALVKSLIVGNGPRPAVKPVFRICRSESRMDTTWGQVSSQPYCFA